MTSSFKKYNDSGKTGLGFCGRTCSGKSGVDNIGVYEFDTVTNTLVTTHLMAEGTSGEPYTSPDGSKYKKCTKASYELSVHVYSSHK